MKNLINTKKNIIIAAITIVCVLAAAYFLQNSGEKSNTDLAETNGSESSVSMNVNSGEEAAELSDQSVSSFEVGAEVGKQASSPAEAEHSKVVSSATESQHINQPATAAQEPPKQAVPESEIETLHCSLKINCSDILNNIDKLAKGKESLVPSDGCLLYLSDVKFEEGDTVFDVLKRELQGRNMHLEFSTTPAYKTVYIEGICNLYEFDCGELSGWKYAVNGVLPSYSCSEYVLLDGDVVTWNYTCDL